jgi:hypothetical protein
VTSMTGSVRPSRVLAYTIPSLALLDCMGMSGFAWTEAGEGRRPYIGFQPTLRCAGVLFSDARLRPSPCFPSLSIGEEWSAGRRPGGLRDLLGQVCETRPHAKLPGPKGFEGGGGPGARGPLRGARAPLGAPSRHALSAAAPCSVFGRRDRRRLRLSKAWPVYRAGKRRKDYCDFECEFTGDGGVPEPCPYPSARLCAG